jgi:hypothetical protein
MAGLLKVTLFWYVIHSLIECCQPFRRSYCLRLQIELSVLKIEVEGSYEKRKKVQQSRYRPGVSQRVPGSYGPQIT